MKVDRAPLHMSALHMTLHKQFEVAMVEYLQHHNGQMLDSWGFGFFTPR